MVYNVVTPKESLRNDHKRTPKWGKSNARYEADASGIVPFREELERHRGQFIRDKQAQAGFLCHPYPGPHQRNAVSCVSFASGSDIHNMSQNTATMTIPSPSLPSLENLNLSEPATPDHQCWIDGLPDELISDILALAVPQPFVTLESVDHGNYIIDRLDFPITIQLVCQRWKAIALATPALWAILRFSDPRKPGLPFCSLQYLKRSGAMPLEVHIHISDEAPVYNAGSEEELTLGIALILEVIAGRTRKLTIAAETCRVLHMLVKALPQQFESLTELSANGYDTTDADERAALSFNAPLVQKLHINAYALDWSRMPICPNLQELCITESAASLVQVDVFAKALQALPHLRVLELENQIITLWEDAELLAKVEPFVLEKLEVMTLRMFYARELNLILGLIGTPRLETFSTVALFENDQEELNRWTVRLEMKLPTLQTLVIGRLDWAYEIAKELPHIKHLAFLRHADDRKDDFDAAFGYLRSYWKSLSYSLPLETLKTSGVHLSSLLLLLTEARSSTVPLLHRISVHYSDVLVSESLGDFANQKREWAELSELVEVEVFDIAQAALTARAQVHTYKEEKEWCLEWNL